MTSGAPSKGNRVMTTGVVGMDEVHRDMFAQMNGLLTGSDSDVAQGMGKLVALMEQDFREEEALMERISYPGLRQHMEQHARVMGALNRIEAGDVPAARAALVLLPQWFEMHLATLDTALAVAIGIAESDGPLGPARGRLE